MESLLRPYYDQARSTGGEYGRIQSIEDLYGVIFLWAYLRYGDAPQNLNIWLMPTLLRNRLEHFLNQDDVVLDQETRDSLSETLREMLLGERDPGLETIQDFLHGRALAQNHNSIEQYVRSDCWDAIQQLRDKYNYYV